MQQGLKILLSGLLFILCTKHQCADFKFPKTFKLVFTGPHMTGRESVQDREQRWRTREVDEEARIWKAANKKRKILASLPLKEEVMECNALDKKAKK